MQRASAGVGNACNGRAEARWPRNKVQKSRTAPRGAPAAGKPAHAAKKPQKSAGGDAPPAKTSSNVLCNFFLNGSCQYGARCKHKHSLKAIVPNFAAHSDCIVACLLAAHKAADGAFPLWTSAKDMLLKCWKVSRSVDPFSANIGCEKRRWNLVLEKTVPCEALVTAMATCAELLVCGCNNGEMRLFSSTGELRAVLSAHAGEINALVVAQGALVSTDFQGNVRWWAVEDLGVGRVSCSLQSELNLGAGLLKFKPLSATNLVCVGGKGFAGVYDLQQKTWAVRLDHMMHDAFCMDIVFFDNTIGFVLSSRTIFWVDKFASKLLSTQAVEGAGVIVCATAYSSPYNEFILLGDDAGAITLLNSKKNFSYETTCCDRENQVRFLGATNEFFVAADSKGFVSVYC